ncbi:MAG TPA: thermonuclease family protein [Thermoleophilaceae bacterium]|nr:thermonuclease family protein [Thermoleophilaceae bacterium]
MAHVDGDTIKVRERRPSGRRHTVRLIGIDAPETKRPGVAVECGGPQASASLARLAPIGARVLLRTDPSQQERDRYGRLLAYVQRRGGDLGRVQIGRGWATPYVYARKPFQRLDAYRGAERDAARAGRGAHSLCGGDFHL